MSADAERAGRRFTLDGEPVDLQELLDANRDGLDPDELDAIGALRPGESITFGGGAWATFVVACEHHEGETR